MSLRPDALLSHSSGPAKHLNFQWAVDRLIWLLKNEQLGC